MDETDVKLLGKLLSDARLSYRRIADEIRISAPTVLARVKKLEKESIIRLLIGSVAMSGNICTLSCNGSKVNYKCVESYT